jgi:hypothetical protein
MQFIESKGFYFPKESWMENVKEDSCYMAYFRSTRRRFLSPGGAASAIVVRYYGYRGYYNDQMYLESQYAYHSIYDAMRQVFAYKGDEYDGKIELLVYTDESGFELIRSWEYEIEGYVDLSGDNQIDCEGWEKVA